MINFKNGDTTYSYDTESGRCYKNGVEDSNVRPIIVGDEKDPEFVGFYDKGGKNVVTTLGVVGAVTKKDLEL